MSFGWKLWTVVMVCSCSSGQTDSASDARFEFAEPTAGPTMRGSGGPQVSFDVSELWTNCAFLMGTDDDIGHHNGVAGYRGHLVLPWAPEWSIGGLSLFDMADPCDPVRVSDGFGQRMRETHAMGFVHLADGPSEGDWAFTTQLKGIMAWDLTDERTPVVASELELDGIFYPDAYARVVFSLFVQYPYLYVAGADNGLYVIDITDPRSPELLSTYVFEPGLRAGMVSVVGNRMLVVSAEQTDAAVLDVSDPVNPQLVPGGRFTVTDGDGTPREAYAGNLVGDMALMARKDGGGGVIIFDVSEGQTPAFWTEHHIDDGGGGYVFWHEGVAFVGDSTRGDVIDFSDMSNPVLLGTGLLPGDLDTITPYGNIAVLSVDDEAEEGKASAVMPWRAEPDSQGPTVLTTSPMDGAEGVPVTARIGVGFDEQVDSASVFAGSIRLWDGDGYPVDGWGSAQEANANYSPKKPLMPGTIYTVEVLPDGIRDLGGNAVEVLTTFTFTTAGAR